MMQRLLINLLVTILLAWLTPACAWAGEASFVFAGLSLTPEPFDKTANLAKLERYARQAAAKGANVIATPEGYLEGYVGHKKYARNLTREKYVAVGEELGGPMLTRISHLARELRVYLLIGFAERREDKMYNSAVIFSPEGAVALRYSKSHNAGDDEPFNTKGTEFPVSETSFGRWGALICFDRRLPETARILALKGAQFILVPAYGSYGETNDIMMRVRAYENEVWLAFVHPKRCLVVDAGGKVVAQSSGEGDQIVMATIRLSENAKPHFLVQRRPELYGEIVRPR